MAGENSRANIPRSNRRNFDLVRRHILRSDIAQIVELGVSIGFIAANIVASNKVNYFGIEASPPRSRGLRQHSQQRPLEFSVARREFLYRYTGREYVKFGEGYNSLVGKVGRLNGTEIQLPAATFGDIVRRFDLHDLALIVDIEGAEAEVLFRDPASLTVVA